MPTYWRVFPWDPRAEAGQQFSPSFVPSSQGSGRFDLPGRSAGVLYLAETQDHAVAELIQGMRGNVLEAEDLTRWNRELALVSVEIEDQIVAKVADLCDPAILQTLVLRPDLLAARERAVTQGLSQAVLDAGYSGLRWWSAFIGEWHGTVLFLESLDPETLIYGEPEVLDLSHAAVREAAAILDIVVE
jgi:hypothetical protein